MKFKLFILQSMNTLSDAKTERMVRRYLSWMLFWVLKFGDAASDENTIRHFRNRLSGTGLVRKNGHEVLRSKLCF